MRKDKKEKEDDIEEIILIIYLICSLVNSLDGLAFRDLLQKKLSSEEAADIFTFTKSLADSFLKQLLKGYMQNGLDSGIE